MAPAGSDNTDEGLIGWTWAALEPEPSLEEAALLDKFSVEYLVDHDCVAAALRCGFQYAFAEHYGKQFLSRAYVQKRLRALAYSDVDKHAESDYDQKLVLNTLRAVAADRRSTPASRVAAAAKLAVIRGMDRPTPASAGHAKGGVLVVPAIADLSAWEQAAADSQTALAEASRV